ncbi:MAG TPA: PQQ-binding-like beta-propeller repeat protein [Phycisphaerales bacterium]|nr:PQQ-binding-like beta-propeller repeat protein [Phycisphaerales bacterium]HMP38319.1 PQQ-binding-like beta-propeller repeat protein [Phycisphaerales bacterium]
MTSLRAAGAPSTLPHSASTRRALFGAALATVLGSLVACETAPRAEGETGSAAASSAAGAEAGALSAARTGPPTAEELDARMIIGPTAARTLGYRVAWESGPFTAAPETLKLGSPLGDSVFIIDTRNNLTRLRTADGIRIWSTPVGGPADVVYDILRVDDPSGDRVMVLTDGALFVFDGTNGVMIDRQALRRPANTKAVLVGPFVIYGGRTGQIVWHQARVGHHWRVNEISGSIRAAPIVAGSDIAVASTTGDVAVMDVGTARTIWTKRLLAGIVAPMATARGFLFIAGQDQYLWAIDVGDGRTIWKHFNDAPLTTGPIVLGDRLYQRIPSRGITCFDAFVKDRLDGVILWSNPDVPGQVIGLRGNALLAWDEPSRTLTMLDRSGGVMHRIALPKVARLRLESPENGDLYALDDAGRITRLVPR